MTGFLLGLIFNERMFNMTYDRNEINNCHYRACKARTDNLSRIKKEVALEFGSKLSFCPKMTEKNKLSCPTLIGHLSQIKKEVAEIFGSLKRPKMTEKGLCPKMTVKNKISGRSLEFFAFAKNRDDSSLFLASPQKGRSMVEMLGVLAIVGVLSVGGIAGYSKAMMTMKINKTIEQISHMASAIKTAYMNQGDFIDENGLVAGKYSNLETSTAIAIGTAPAEMVSESGNTLQNVFGGRVTVDGNCGDGLEEGYHVGGAFALSYEDLPKEACIALVTHNWNGIFQGIDFGNKSTMMPDYALLLSDVLANCEDENKLPDWLVSEEGSGLAVIGCNNEPFYVSPADAALGCTCEENKCEVAFVTND